MDQAKIRYIPIDTTGYWLYVLFSLVILVLVGCASEADTCSQGENMTNPRLVDGLEVLDDGYRVRITWDQGTKQGTRLPKRYFEAVSVEDKLGIVQSISLTDEREITIKFIGLSSYLQKKKSVDLSLIFPDREQFIACRHPGMSDMYLLKLSLTFTDENELDQVTFEQSVRFGPI
ncbi:MAG: hypothetical protein H6631_12695 [Anaerolineaceae bacterium]|nr:hypothetical protein [Anaerolineaceae bacterium]